MGVIITTEELFNSVMETIKVNKCMEIDKPRKGKTQIIQINNSGFRYRIGVRNSKFVSAEEVTWALKMLHENMQFTRKEYQAYFAKISVSNPCNFTSIGGLLKTLGYVNYSIGKYYLI